jgi:hypothetical protein
MKLRLSLLAVGCSTAMIYAQGTPAPAPTVQAPAPAVQAPAPAVQAPTASPPIQPLPNPTPTPQLNLPQSARPEFSAPGVQPPGAVVQPPAPAVQPPAPTVQPPAPTVQPPGTIVVPPGAFPPGIPAQQPGFQSPTASPPIQPLPDPTPTPQLNVPQTLQNLPPLAQQQNVQVQALPPGIRRSILGQVGNVPVQVQRGQINGQHVFQILYTDQGVPYVLRIRHDGTVITPATPLGLPGKAVAPAQLPPRVIDSLMAQFGSIPAGQIRLVGHQGTPLYEIQYMQNGVPVRMLMSEQGQIVSTGIAPQSGIVGAPGYVAPGFGGYAAPGGFAGGEPTFLPDATGFDDGQAIRDPAGVQAHQGFRDPGQQQGFGVPQQQQSQQQQPPPIPRYQTEGPAYPDLVQRTVRKESRGAQIESVDRKTTTVYVARFDKDGKATELRVLPDGRLLPGTDRGEAGDFADPLVHAREVAFDETPYPVQETLLERAGLALIDELKTGQVLGRRAYEAEFTREGRLVKLRLDAEGRLIGLRESTPAVARDRARPESIELRQAPDPVREAIHQHTEGVALKSLTREPLDIYHFVLGQRGIPFELQIAENGTVLRGPSLPDTAFQMSELPAPVRETVRQYGEPGTLRIEREQPESPREDRTARRNGERIDEAAGARTAPQTIRLEELPAAVRVAITTEAGRGEIIEVRQIKRFGKPVYEGVYRLNGQEHRVLVGPDGGIILPESAPAPDAPGQPQPQ